MSANEGAHIAESVAVIAAQLSKHVLLDSRTGTRYDESVAQAVVVALGKAGFEIVRHSDGEVSL